MAPLDLERTATAEIRKESLTLAVQLLSAHNYVASPVCCSDSVKPETEETDRISNLRDDVLSLAQSFECYICKGTTI
ncbi:hypothetical protein BS162P1_00082 [Bacteroides phage BS162P1]|jgi:hypothetical protein|nr:hypothetical protein BS162P1_00082 [Bacteroides phage BS162P1]DAV31128.1 MAG TPA: hypothetical protein [Caudoviricetes sp.]